MGKYKTLDDTRGLRKVKITWMKLKINIILISKMCITEYRVILPGKRFKPL